MDRIRQIIREAVNNQVLFSDLNILANQLEREGNGLRQSRNNTAEISQFFGELYKFTAALVNAIRRCVRKQSLNEISSGWGFEDSPTLSNMYYSMKQGFNQDLLGDMASNFRQIKNNFTSRGRNSYRQNGNGGGGATNIPNNEKLQILLTQYYPLIHQKYTNLNRKYNNAIVNMNPAYPKNIIQYTEDVIQTINNAQGQNP